MADARNPWIPYCGAGSAPADWLDRWNPDPFLILVTLVFLVAGYTLRRRAFRAQTGAALIVAVLFVSPLCALGSALFAFRAVHHLALILLLAPVLVQAMGNPQWLSRVSLRAATALQAGVFWAWHIPSLYEAALASNAVFWGMQGTITASAVLWWAALRRASPLGASASLLAQTVLMGVLGALIVFAGRPLYAPHWLTTQPWGLTPLEDQQIAGLVMWVGGGGATLLLAVVLLYRALSPARALAPRSA